jgi:hypothetical protein
MSQPEIHNCQCSDCVALSHATNQSLHQQMNLLLSRLDEQQRRWYVALEANKVGHGGLRLLSQITGLDEKTIARGQQELAEQLASRPIERVRHPGGGRPSSEKKTLL